MQRLLSQLYCTITQWRSKRSKWELASRFAGLGGASAHYL